MQNAVEKPTEPMIRIGMLRNWEIDDYHQGVFTEYRMKAHQQYTLPHRLGWPLITCGYAYNAEPEEEPAGDELTINGQRFNTAFHDIFSKT